MGGILEEAFIEFAKSSNTYEDASFSKPIVLKHCYTNIIVITSDYHIERAKIIFEREYSDSKVKIKFKACNTNEEICEIDLTSLKGHEMKTLKKIKNGS